MSRIEDVAQASCFDRPIPRRRQQLPCGRCHAVIEYGRGTEWSVVNGLANEHWEVCPMKPLSRLAHMAPTLTSPSDTEVALPPPVASEQRSCSNPTTESVSSSNNPWISTGCERKRRTLEQRKVELEQDEYAKRITTKSVVCGGCHKEISLDKRSKYYPGLWHKHRSKCPGIEKLEREKAMVPHVLEGLRQVSRSVTTPSVGDHSYGDALPLGPAERYQSHSVTATHRSIPHYDSGNMSNEEEEEDEALLPSSFPTLNCAFYHAQQQNSHTNGWAYRYATKEEITTNLFRGQNEPYVRPVSRPFAHPSLWAGGYCETSRCVIKDSRVEHTQTAKELSERGNSIAPHAPSSYNDLPSL